MSDEELAIEEQDAQQQAAGSEEEELSEEEQAKADLKEAIAVETEEIGPLRLKLTVTIPEESLNKRRGKEFSDLKRDAMIPGFRKGHAPMALVEKRFASDVGEQLKSWLLSNSYLAAVEKRDLKPLGDPMFWASVTEERIDENKKPRRVEIERLLPLDESLEHITVPKKGSMTFCCELELKPAFELPELKGIPIERPKVSITKEDVDREVERIRMLRGRFEPVEKGAVKLDDMLIGDLKITVDGDAIVSEENFDVAARDVRVKGIVLSGFGDAVKGKKREAVVKLEAAVPEDHDNIAIRGKQAMVEFTIQDVKRLSLPPIDRDFLENIGFESEEELRETLKTSLESQLEETLRAGMRRQVGDYLIDHTAIEIPDTLSQRQTERTIQRHKIELYQRGMPEAQIDKQIDELRGEALDQTVRDLKLFFILEKIAEERDISVGEERMNAAIAQIAQQSNRRFDRVRDELSKGDGLMTLYLKLRDQQVLGALLEEAVITEAKLDGPKKKASSKKTGASKKTTAKKKTTTKKTTAKKKTS